jgi:Restriction endonuclease
MDAVDKMLSVEYRRAIANDPCVYCGASGEHDDHVVPLSKAGTDHWHNIVRACERCNLAKSAHDLDHFLEVILPTLITDPSTHAQSS